MCNSVVKYFNVVWKTMLCQFGNLEHWRQKWNSYVKFKTGMLMNSWGALTACYRYANKCRKCVSSNVNDLSQSFDGDICNNIYHDYNRNTTNFEPTLTYNLFHYIFYRQASKHCRFCLSRVIFPRFQSHFSTLTLLSLSLTPATVGSGHIIISFWLFALISSAFPKNVVNWHCVFLGWDMVYVSQL